MSYNTQQRAALSTIRRRGTQTTLTRTVAGVRDVVAQSTAGGGAQTQAVAVVILPVTELADMSMDDRVLVRKGQRHLMIAALKPDGSALDWPIEDEQTIAIEGAAWRLAGVSPLRPDGATTVLYEAEARR